MIQKHTHKIQYGDSPTSLEFVVPHPLKSTEVIVSVYDCICLQVRLQALGIKQDAIHILLGERCPRHRFPLTVVIVG